MPEDVNFEEELNKLQGTWEQAQSREEREKIDDGDYILEVKSMELSKSARTGEIQVRTTFETMPVAGEPDFLRRTLTKWDNLSDPDRAGFFKDMLLAMELEYPDSIADIEPVLAQAPGLIVWANVQNRKSKKDPRRTFVNVFVNRRVGDDEVEE